MTDTISPRKLEVQLMVDHPQLQSAELEKLLTLPADEHWDAGQSYRPSPGSPEQRYQFSRWALRALANSLDELADAMHVLTQRIQGIEKNFHLLPNDTIVSLTLFVTETDTVIGVGIDAEAIKLLARINAGIEVGRKRLGNPPRTVDSAGNIQRYASAGCQRCGNSSPMRLVGVVGKRVSTSLRYT